MYQSLYVTTAVIYSDNTMGSCAESFSDSNDIERAALKLLFLNARRMQNGNSIVHSDLYYCFGSSLHTDAEIFRLQIL